MSTKDLKNSNAITLIALVITIIVLLILAAISLNVLLGDTGILSKAQSSKEATRAGAVEEKRDLWFAEVLSKRSTNDINGYTPLENILSNLQSQNLLTSEEVQHILDPENINKEVTIHDKVISFDVDLIFNNDYKNDDNDSPDVDIAEVLKPGDFINYDAGIWTETEITSLINAGYYTTENLPETPFTFGGFKANDDRNTSIDAYSGSNITTNPEFKKGWKVLSIKNGVIKIITAGTVEAYRHSQYSIVSGFYSGGISEYILRNGKPYNDSEHTLEDYIATGIIPRDFSMYENDLAVPGSAHCTDIYEMYYIGNTLDSSTDPLRNLGIFYHIASAQENTALGRIEPSGSIFMSANTCYGIRIVLTLNSNVIISPDNTGDGSNYENAWKISLDSNK